MERAVALCLGTRVEVNDLPEEVRQARSDLPAAGESRRLEDVERSLILATLAEHDGNRARAAEVLGIGVATLYRKLKHYGAAGGEGTPPTHGPSAKEASLFPVPPAAQ